jgi:cytochrome oxidase Cu insertion factor (SCO1/SenC/PrrC family)
MKSLIAFVLGLSFLGMVGCEKKQAEDTHVVKRADGSETKDSTVQKKDSNGTVTTETQHKEIPADRNK